MAWSNEQRAFAVEIYFSQSQSIVAVQRAFLTRYQIPPTGPSTGPKIHSVVGWELQGTGSVSKKWRGRPRTSQTPENIEAIRRSVLQSPRRSVTVNSERYVAMIQEFFAPALEELNAGLVWFQQDGATAHTARKSMVVSRKMFPGRLISLRGDISWPARWPDLTPCDYFLWGYLKAELFKHRPRTLQALKDAIRLQEARIPHDMLDRVMGNIRIRL